MYNNSLKKKLDAHILIRPFFPKTPRAKAFPHSQLTKQWRTISAPRLPLLASPKPVYASSLSHIFELPKISTSPSNTTAQNPPSISPLKSHCKNHFSTQSVKILKPQFRKRFLHPNPSFGSIPRTPKPQN